MSLDWKKYFDKRVLERGMDYWRMGFVRGVMANQKQCRGKVLGQEEYTVRIFGMDTGDLTMECNCPQGKLGAPCKHEVAVLLKWEEEFQKTETTKMEPEMVLFKEDEEHERLYYNLPKLIKDVPYTTQDAREAKEIVETGRIQLETPLQTSFVQGQKYMTAVAMVSQDGKFEDETTHRVHFAFSRDRIHEIRCAACGYELNGWEYAGYRKPMCKEALALMLALDEYLILHNPGDETDEFGMAFLKAYGHQAKIQAAEEQKVVADIHLSPRITRDADGFHLGFKVGAGKMYVVKNLTELVENVTNKESVHLGKKNAISFAEETFDDMSVGYYGLIQEQVRNAQAQQEQIEASAKYVSGVDLTVKESILLQGAALEQFYEIAKGRKVDYDDKMEYEKENKHLIMKSTDPQLELTLEPVWADRGRGAIGLNLYGDLPDLIVGVQHRFVFGEGSLGPVEQATMERLQPLWNSGEFGELNVTIGKKYLPEFYYRILPKLEEDSCITINRKEEEVIEELVPPQAFYTFWMDLDDGDVTCLANVRYDQEEFTLRPLTREELPLKEPRNEGQEQLVLDTLSQVFETYDSESVRFTCDGSDDKVFELLSGGMEQLLRIGEVQATDEFSRLKIRRKVDVQIGVSVESNLLSINLASGELDQDELMEILESYRKKKRFHRLRNGDFVELQQNAGIEALVQMMDEMGVSVEEFTEGKMDLPLYRALYVNKLLEQHDEIASDRDKTFRSLIRSFKSVEETDAVVPKKLQPILHHYQTYGFQWMSTMIDAGFGGILADDMGLGKTLQMITLLYSRILEDPTRMSLIVTPASLVYNWEEEFHKFAPEIRVQVVAGSADEREVMIQGFKVDHPQILITSYDLLKRDVRNYAGIQFDCQILDEAQYIKNPKATVSKSVKVITADHKFALTGTPIENRLSELWSIFDYLMPGVLYTYDIFREELETPITKEKDEEATDRLRRMVGPFILRRLKSEVLTELPDKLEEVRYARFEQEQQNYYDAQVQHMQKLLHDPEVSKIQILAELTKLRQICCDPNLLTESYKGQSAKLEACMDLITSAMDGGHKILLFSQFTSMLEILEKALEKNKISYYKITGATKKQERVEMVHKFNEDDTPVFLISLKAGGTGLNLTGADVVIHYDPWWNLAAQNQATDRAYRMGQEREVSVFRLIAKGTVEEKILEMQEAKKDLADAILTGETASLGQLTTDEFMELLS